MNFKMCCNNLYEAHFMLHIAGFINFFKLIYLML